MSFWEDVAGEVGRGPAQDFVLLLEQLVALSQLPKLRGVVLGPAATVARRGRRGEAVLAVGDLQPALQTALRDPEIAGDLGDRRLALAGHGDHVTPELRRERLGHDADPSSEAAASQARSQPNRGQAPVNLLLEATCSQCSLPATRSPVSSACTTSARTRAWRVAAVNGASPAAARVVQAATVPTAIGVPNSSASSPAVRATGRCWPRTR